MSAKLSVGELLRLACIWAEQDREAFIMATAHCESPSDVEAREKAEQFIQQVRAYRRKRWGRTEGDAAIDALAECESVSPLDIAPGPDSDFEYKPYTKVMQVVAERQAQLDKQNAEARAWCKGTRVEGA
jgi:hypothetical protein